MGTINAGEHRTNGKKIEFVPIKPAKKESINIAINESMHHSLLSFLERDGALNLFMNHCAKEFCLENILALIELTQFETYCKKQKKNHHSANKIKKKECKETNGNEKE